MTDDRTFLERFDACTIAREEWNHQSHLRMAFLMLREWAFPEAVQRIRNGIRRLNRANGVEDGRHGGYHETLTLTWSRLIASRIGPRNAAGDFGAFIAAHPELLARDLPLEHYTPERLFSARARREFVLPDRKPLPPVEAPRLADRATRSTEAPAERRSTETRSSSFR